MMNVDPESEWKLEPIAAFQLRYNQDAPRIVSADSHVGSYIGSGTGEAKGPLLNGKIHWDLFEAEGETLCAANFWGQVETTEGTRSALPMEGRKCSMTRRGNQYAIASLNNRPTTG